MRWGAMPEQVAVITVLLERPICLDCLAVRTGRTTIEVDRFLTSIGHAIELARHDSEPCRMCGILGPTFALR